MTSLYSFEDAVVAYVTREWGEKAHSNLGRIIIQKLCYFLKHEGVPINYRFRLHQFGPFSQELFFRMKELENDDVIRDNIKGAQKSAYIVGDNAEEVIALYHENIKKFKPNMDRIIEKLGKYNFPEKLELLATIHFFYNARLKFNKKAPSKEEIVAEIKGVKNKFSYEEIEEAYDYLQKNNLINKN